MQREDSLLKNGSTRLLINGMPDTARMLEVNPGVPTRDSVEIRLCTQKGLKVLNLAIG